MNAGIFFIKPTFSKKASMPTRLGEYLASGVPCLCNTGIGDIDRLFEKERMLQQELVKSRAQAMGLERICMELKNRIESTAETKNV